MFFLFSPGQASVMRVGLLLLALLVPAHTQSGDGDDEDDREKMAYACENSLFSMDCPEGRVIRIRRANYGRISRRLCNPDAELGMNLNCVSITSRDIVASSCDGHPECSFKVNNQRFGDPCQGTSKYIEVGYICELAEKEVPLQARTQQPTHQEHMLPWLRRMVPVPENVQVCHHAMSHGSIFDITWSMAATDIDFLNFHLKYRSQGTHSEEMDIIANFLGDGKYAFSWRPTVIGHTYEFAVQASSLSVGKGIYSDFVLSVFCEGEPVATDPASTTTDIIMQPTPATVRMCEEEVNMGVTWPETRPDVVRSNLCPPPRRQGIMLYKCLKTGVWDPNGPETENCAPEGREDFKPDDKTTTSSTTTTTTTTPSAFIHTTRKLVDLQEPQPSVASLEKTDREFLTASPGQHSIRLTSLTQNMSSELNKVKDRKQRKVLADEFKESIMSTGDEMLHDHGTWRNLSASEQRSTAAFLLTTMETMGLLAASTMDAGSASVTRRANLVMKLLNMDLRSGQNATLLDPADANTVTRFNQFTIPVSALRQIAGSQIASVPVVFVVFTNLSEWLTPSRFVNQTRSDSNTNSAYISDTPGQDPPRRIINSDIISATISHNRVQKLDKPVIFLVEHGQVEAVTNPRCSFWDTVRSEWSSNGCFIQSTNKTHTTCECYHLTSFAVLMDITGATLLLPGSVRFSLELITYIGCTISIICLVLSWATFACFKSLDCDRNTIHKHLVFCLLVAQIVLVIGIQQTQLRVLCGIIAGALHYLFLAAFAWMCLEGVQLYAMLIEVFESERSRVLWYYLFGYGTPAIIVAISAGIFSGGYGTALHCWLSTERGFIWSFIGPALAVMLVNVFMLSMAICIMVRHSAMSHTMRQKTIPQKMRTWIKGAVVLVVLLGLTWLFGVLYLDKNTLIFCYLFTILNSLQGLFIFLFHCVLNEKVQKEYRRLVRHSHWLPEIVRVRYGGASSSGSRENSSSGNVMSRFLRGKKRLSNGDSSSNSAQPFLKKDQRHISSSVPSSSDGATSSRLSSDTSHNNNNPRKASQSSTQRSSAGNTKFLKPPDVNGINGDLSEVLDCSVVDSEFVSEYMQRNLQVSVEVKRYSTASEDSGRGGGGMEEERDRLAALSVESLSKQRRPFNASSDFGDGDDGAEEPSDDGKIDDNDSADNDMGREEGYEHVSGTLQVRLPAERQPLLKQSESERVLINNAVNKPRLLDQPSPRQSPSLKHVNTGMEHGAGTGSTPNLSFKPGLSPVSPIPAASSPDKEVINSLPNLSGGGQIPGLSVQGEENSNDVTHTPGVKRHSSDGHVYFSPFRFSGSEC